MTRAARHIFLCAPTLADIHAPIPHDCSKGTIMINEASSMPSQRSSWFSMLHIRARLYVVIAMDHLENTQRPLWHRIWRLHHGPPVAGGQFLAVGGRRHGAGTFQRPVTQSVIGLTEHGGLPVERGKNRLSGNFRGLQLPDFPGK